MVVDCGGGTVDITVHEITNSDGQLRELFKATGGPYGSVSKRLLLISNYCIIAYIQVVIIFFPLFWEGNLKYTFTIDNTSMNP